jgi:hypothetical protein
MLDRQRAQQILKVNGITSDVTSEQARELLMQAGWCEADVSILEEKKSLVQKESMQTLVKSDNALTPQNVSALLGIDMLVTQFPKGHAPNNEHLLSSFLQVFVLLFCTVLFATFTIVSAMWYMQVGIFHIAFR